MPGYVIHLAVGKVYSQHNKIKDLQRFERGIIMPDTIKDKSKSHYGPASSQPDLNKFIQINGISSSYDEGYFLHLFTDYLFYNRFLKRWEPSIYEDYDKLNAGIIQRYNIELMEEIKGAVRFKTGTLTLLSEEQIYHFIETVGRINVREIVKQKDFSFERGI